MSRSDAGESRITRDRDTIRGWVGEHDSVPVRYSGVEGESGTLRIVPETRREESHEELTWDEFFEIAERDDQVVVYHGEEATEPFEVTSREQAIGRTTVSDDDVETALMEGETVTSEVVETTVVERTIVEEATVESEVTDRELLNEEVVDAELLTRDVVGCEFVGAEADVEGRWDADSFRPDARQTFTDGLGIELTVDEGWTVTKELVERLTVESRVVDTEATETEAVEADTVESSVNIEGVQRTVLESDLVDTQAGVEQVGTDRIQSEFHEGEVVRTQLIERKTVDEEVSLRRRLFGEVTEAETFEFDTIRREVVESEIVGEEDVEAEFAAMGSTMGTTTAGTEMGDESMSMGDETVMPSEDDEGKTVVDAMGEEVGMVVGVEGDMLYVDPHPSITDRIKSALGWSDADEDDYPIGPEQIAAITDDRVELASVEPSMEDDDAGMR